MMPHRRHKFLSLSEATYETINVIGNAIVLKIEPILKIIKSGYSVRFYLVSMVSFEAVKILLSL